MMQLLKLAPNKLLSAVTSCSSVGLLKGILYFGTILSAGLMTLSYKLSSDRSELLSGFATTGGEEPFIDTFYRCAIISACFLICLGLVYLKRKNIIIVSVELILLLVIFLQSLVLLWIKPKSIDAKSHSVALLLEYFWQVNLFFPLLAIGCALLVIFSKGFKNHRESLTK